MPLLAFYCWHDANGNRGRMLAVCSATTTAHFISFMVKGTYFNSKKSFLFLFFEAFDRLHRVHCVLGRLWFGRCLCLCRSNVITIYVDYIDTLCDGRCSRQTTPVNLCPTVLYVRNANRITIIIVSSRKLFKSSSERTKSHRQNYSRKRNKFCRFICHEKGTLRTLIQNVLRSTYTRTITRYIHVRRASDVGFSAWDP